MERVGVKHCTEIYSSRLDPNSHPQLHHLDIGSRLRNQISRVHRENSQVVDSQEESDDDDIYDGFIVHVGTGTTTAETRINHKEDAPDVSLSTDGVESEESKDDDQTVEEESKDEDLTIEE